MKNLTLLLFLEVVTFKKRLAVQSDNLKPAI